MKEVLTSAHAQLFRRAPDECFRTFDDLWQHCQKQKSSSEDLWRMPQEIRAVPTEGRLDLAIGEDRSLRMNSWSFGQLCQFAGVNRDTVNRLSAETAAQVFRETLPDNGKPLQVLHNQQVVRSVHAASYTRLHNVELLSLVREFATDFQPPQEAGGPESSGGSGLYAGEMDMFVFMIDPGGWTDIDGESFAPGFFLWNSEVGKRSVGVQSFWFQAVCRNHIVWDAVEVIDFSRKHTANVHDAVREIRGIIHRLVEKRDARRDGFVQVIRKAMKESLGTEPDDVLALLSKHGIGRAIAKEALEIARTNGRFTIFSVVDALTRIAGRMQYAGDRTDVDQSASSLLALAR
ncbi:MAG: DUF932 domain-containing protein [Planctomycetota bacterium]